jgi:hypothetical protein
MNNKNLLIGVGVAVVVYYLYNQNQKKKLQATTTYDDAELNKLVTDFVNKAVTYTEKREPNAKHKTFKEIFDGTMQIINNAKTNGKDVSKNNIDKLLSILELQYRNESGDLSLGQTTKEQFDFIVNLTQEPTPVHYSNGFFPKTPVDVQNNQLNNLGFTKEQCEKAGKKYTEVEVQCIKAPCSGLGICN